MAKRISVETLYRRITVALTRLQAWVEARPRAAWCLALLLLLVPVAIETSYWVRADYPVATWHHQPPGIEVEVVHARAATAGWKELRGYWTGRIIHGNDYYQPLTSWLFVAEYRLFGTDNRRWTVLNVLLHPLCVLVLAWATSRLVPGPPLRRMATGVLTGFLFGAPGLADRESQAWIVSWWPVQPDILALILGLLLLACVAAYIDTGRRRWLILAPVLFFAAVCFKETAYTVGLGACLLLLRRPKRWALLGVLAASGLLFFWIRHQALQGAVAFGQDNQPGRVLAALAAMPTFVGQTLEDASLPLAVFGVGFALPYVFRRPVHPGWGLLSGAALFTAVGSYLYAPPWETSFLKMVGPALEVVGGLLFLAGLVLALRRWPWPEIAALFLMNQFLALCFTRSLGWHGYWSGAFFCMAWAAVLLQLGEWAARRLKARYGRPVPATL